MLSPKLLDILRSYWKKWHTPRNGYFPAAILVSLSRGTPSNSPARWRIVSPASPSQLLRIRFDMRLPCICSSPAAMFVPFNCCLVIAAWPPRPDICGSRPVKSVLRPARWICSHARFLLRQSPCRRNISEHRADGTLRVGSGGCLPPPWRSLSRAPWRFAVHRTASRHECDRDV